ncbi:phosphate acyltransferase, partial [Acinetobacter baumannii]
FRDFGYGTPVLVGRTQGVLAKLVELGVSNPESYEIHNSTVSPLVPEMVEFLYPRLQRRGFMTRDVQRMVNNERNVFASLLVALGHADAMISGMT